MPREFIPNIDTANEEIVRLDTSITTLEQAATENATKLQLAETAKTEAEGKVTAAEQKFVTEQQAHSATKSEMQTKIDDLQKKVDAGSKNSVTAAAAAGAAPVLETPQAAEQGGNKTAGLTGLARAQAANAALQKK